MPCTIARRQGERTRDPAVRPARRAKPRGVGPQREISAQQHRCAKFRSVRCSLLVALVIGASIPACSRVGPSSLRQGRGSYNAAIQQTNSEQLLLNLVRLRYRDAPLFLEVTSISSSLSIELGATVGAAASAQGTTVSPGSGVTYVERPTITYAPLQGSRFGKQFLRPLELEDIELLYRSGWAIDRILKVFVQRLGPLQNAPRASGPTPDAAPEFADFFAAAGILRSLWTEGRIELRRVTSVAGGALVLNIDPAPDAADRVAALSRLLGLSSPTSTLVLDDRAATGDPNAVPLVPRSLLGGMYYVSHGVEVPQADLAAGRVPTTRTSDGAAFDWAHLTGALMRVRHSARPPAGAYVAVQHRGLWFFIDDSDLDSKSTFSFLAQVLELQSGEIKGGGPLLTLPIAAE